MPVLDSLIATRHLLCGPLYHGNKLRCAVVESRYLNISSEYGAGGDNTEAQDGHCRAGSRRESRCLLRSRQPPRITAKYNTSRPASLLLTLVHPSTESHVRDKLTRLLSIITHWTPSRCKGIPLRCLVYKHTPRLYRTKCPILQKMKKQSSQPASQARSAIAEAGTARRRQATTSSPGRARTMPCLVSGKRPPARQTRHSPSLAHQLTRFCNPPTPGHFESDHQPRYGQCAPRPFQSGLATGRLRKDSRA